ncbi:MAG TPA: hypothetical protein PKD68_03445 [Candidatus Saccharibacteria bacterium]|nr:hypothetical protein [Candidatus Saccharibacteria bacterium]
MKVLLLCRRLPRLLLDARVWIGVFGLIMSIAAHELFHILVNWGRIAGVEFLADGHTLAIVVTETLPGYNVVFEEMMAYLITVTVLLLTIVLIGDVHSTKDNRTVAETIFGKNANSVSSEEMMVIAGSLVK